MVFHRSLSDSKSPQVSRTLLCILAVLNNAVVWMVSTRPRTSKSSGPLNPIYQPLRSGTRSIFKRSLTGLNSEFSFSQTSCLTKAEELSLSYYLPIAGGRIIGFIAFPRVLMLWEMQSFTSRI